MVLEGSGISMNSTLRIGRVGISLVLLTVSAGTADALTGTAGTVGISDHDGAEPGDSGQGRESGDENSDRYRDSEVSDEESDSSGDERLVDVDVWNIPDNFRADY